MSRAAQTEAEKTRKFGRYAHALSLAVIAAAALFTLWLAGTILLAPGPADVRVSLGPYFITADKITTAGIKIYALLVQALVFGLLLAALFALRALFADLAAGAIYTQENVARIRRLGLLTLAMPVAGRRAHPARLVDHGGGPPGQRRGRGAAARSRARGLSG